MFFINIQQIPLALYIHIPWCVKKCPYCDFNSHQLTDEIDYAVYVDALLVDARSQVDFMQGRLISSIFIGGGTPSLLPIDQYQRLFAGLTELFDLTLATDQPDNIKLEHQNQSGESLSSFSTPSIAISSMSVQPLSVNDKKPIEVTMEANPATIEHAPFAEYLKVGINRLSIGVQTFNEASLTVLGRIHDANQAIDAIKAAKKAGFKRVNVDLMHGLPKQTPKQALYDIEQAMQAGATHISWYQLTIEPNTVFYRSKPVLPDEDTLGDIEDLGATMLTDKGFVNYEVSAWHGKNDAGCLHNINYWQFGDYLAIGAGAHGKVTLANVAGFEDGIYRFSKSRMPKDYLIYDNEPKMVGWQAIKPQDIRGEFMLDALRLNAGVPMSLFGERTGLSADELQPTLAKFIENGMLENDANVIKATALGRRYLNRIVQAFL